MHVSAATRTSCRAREHQPLPIHPSSSPVLAPTLSVSLTRSRRRRACAPQAWEDDGWRKLRILREFLCLQTLVGRLVVIAPSLALFLCPLGLGISTSIPAIPWWLLSALPLSVFAALIVWIVLSMLGAWPSAMTPWAITPTVLWLDCCCLCDDTPQTIAKGVAGFQRFLSSSDKMVALVSAAYFERLWTVYELASFCRAHRGQLKARLLLLSLEWPSSWSPFKTAKLSADERQRLEHFSCLEAHCYKPADRADLLATIRREWGSEAAFDAFVHTELLEVLAASKAQHVHKLAGVASESAQLMLGD